MITVSPELRTAIQSSEANARQGMRLARSAAQAKLDTSSDTMSETELKTQAEALLGDKVVKPELAWKQLEDLVSAAYEQERSMHRLGWSVRDGIKPAADSYKRLLPETRVAFERVYGEELGSTLQIWRAAREIVDSAKKVSEGLGKWQDSENFIEDDVARPFLEKLEGPIRDFVRDYDGMLRGDKNVSDVFPEAQIFTHYSQLMGKDLPSVFEGIADIVETATTEDLQQLFHRRWLEEGLTEGALPGDLGTMVDKLRTDAEAIREGALFTRSPGLYDGNRYIDLQRYLRGSSDDDPSIPHEVHWGMAPELIWAIAMPNMDREAFEFDQPPTFNDRRSKSSITVETAADGTTQVVIG